MKYDIKITISEHKKSKKKGFMNHAYYDFKIDGDLESNNIEILLSSIRESLTTGKKAIKKRFKKLNSRKNLRRLSGKY